MSQASGNSLVNRTTLRIANGAISGATIEAWTSPSSKTYSQIASMLSKEGLSEKQVQAIWLKNVTDPNSITAGLPSSSADAYVLERMLATAIRAMKVRYPNLKQVFVTSRRYEGYGCPAPPEPFAYEVGFGIKWLVKAQVDQMRNAGTVVDTAAGDLNYNTVAPWIAYGPYLWASGSTPRSDGLFWVRSDYGAAGCHTSDAGTAKAVNQFMQYFLNSAQTPWFRANY
jgi:hypothetical protein